MMYDFANWKPITPAQHVDLLAEIARGSDLKSEVHSIDGSRFRIVFYAEVKSSPEESSIEPYLAILVDEKDKTRCFERRTDVYLA